MTTQKNTNTKSVKLKILTVLLCACFILAAFGCSRTPVQQGGNNVIDNGSSGSDSNGSGTTEDHGTTVFNDGVIGERKTDGSSIGDYSPSSGKSMYEGRAEAEIAHDAALAEAEPYPVYDYEIGIVEPGYNGQIRAGLLTAGEIKDILDTENWISLWKNNDWNMILDSRNLDAQNVITVKTQPLATVQLLDGDKVAYAAVADIYGNATLIFARQYSAAELTVKSGDLSAKVTCVAGANVELTAAANVTPAAPQKLDLLLMIDTTGSMSDELEYIKVELKDMIERVRQEQNVDIRVSVNFYRDEGDEYVVKYFDFRTDIDDCITILGQQCSDGGGDYPEAVHTAINNVLQHNWREDAIKLCFFVLDAPPHSESEIQGINSGMLKDVSTFSAQGIRFIPVVSSGADLSVEALMRSFAVMTGGTYIFLTNDSGIGGDHQTPTDTQYDVEPLNDCMVRVIREYMFAQ